MRLLKNLSLFAAVVATSSPVWAASYQKLASRDQLLGGSTTATFASSVISGGLAYTPMSSGGAGVYSVALPATGPGSLFSTNVSGTLSGAIYDIGSSLSVYDASRQIYRINKSTGSASVYESTATIDGYATANGGTAPATVTASTVDASGETYFYDTKSKTIGKTSGANSLTSPVIPKATLTAYSSTYALAGIAVTASGKLYTGDSNNAAANRNLLTWNGTSLSVALSATDITGVTGGATAAFLASALFAGPDGNIYFYENTSKDILSFDSTSATPASTLKIVLSSADLTSGPEGSNLVSGFSWYNGNLAWYTASGTAGVQGLYAIPEPSAAVGAAGAALLLGRRQRRAR